MVTRSVYIIGGAGTGKSTFTAALLGDCYFGPLLNLHEERNAKNVVTLRGHGLSRPTAPQGQRGGMYLGAMRDEFPGTDALDRATSPVGAAWLRAGDLPPWIVSEGATLATRPFMYALAETTLLLAVHLYASDAVKVQRFAERGSAQKESFVTATATRSANLYRDMLPLPGPRLSVDTSVGWEWRTALDLAATHLWGC